MREPYKDTFDDDVIEKVKTETKKSTKVVTEIDKDKDGIITDNETKLITETTTTKTATTESGKTWRTQIKEKFEYYLENLQDSHKLVKVVNAFNDLKGNVLKKINDSSINPEIEWDAEIRRSNELCDEEKIFLNQRKEYIKESFAKYVGVDVEEIHIDFFIII